MEAGGLYVMRIFLFVSIFIVLFLFPTSGLATNETFTLSAEHAIVMESESGKVLYEKDANVKKPIASITKIMTALIAIENGQLDDPVVISENAEQIYGSSLYLKKGEQMTLESLLYGLMLRSGNDASIAIAEHIGGSEEGFVAMMNEKAEKIGMTNTHLKNPHGLDEADHYSTAYDMALLMREAIKDEQFQQISETKKYKPKEKDYPYINKNQLLHGMYDASTGGKTGFTKRSGRTLISTAKKNKMTLIAVTLNAPDDWKDHMTMFETTFSTYSIFTLMKKGWFTVQNEVKQLHFYVRDDVIYPLKHNEKEAVQMKVIWRKMNEGKKPYAQFHIEEEIIQTIPLEVKENKEDTFYMKFKNWFLRWWK